MPDLDGHKLSLIRYGNLIPRPREEHILSRMPSILVTVFILQLLIHLINTIGASTINAVVSLGTRQICRHFAYCHSYGISTLISPLQLRKQLPINADYRRNILG